MIINKNINTVTLKEDYLYQEPDFFVDDSETKKPGYIKWVMDYFSNIAFQQYQHNSRTFAKNYDLMKGILNIQDFYEDVPEVQSMVDTLMDKEALPTYVKNYSIINAPVNTLVGELSRSPDVHRVRAFDEFSKNEELEYYTNLLQQYVISEGYKKILTKLQMSGADIGEIDPEELQQRAYKEIEDQLTDYSSEAEIWGSVTIEALKAELGLKDILEDIYRDLLICNKEVAHVYEDGSKRGFSVESVNPKNLVRRKSPDQKYLDKSYMIGIIRIMELSEIIDRFPKLTKKEIDFLRKENRGDNQIGRSNIFGNKTGSTTIKYNTYDKLADQQRVILEAEMEADENFNELESVLGLSKETSITNRFTVVEVYYQGKKRVGKLTYVDANGQPQAKLVDENYIAGSPNEIEIEWGWINQKYKGLKIGSYVYQLEPYTFTDSMPILGVEHEIKNTSCISLVDMMKPFQILYNICMNQLFSLLKNEKGRVVPLALRYIPRVKDGDDQDSLEIWEEEAKRSGIMFIDDSPENRGAPQQYQSIDLTKSQEMQTRYQLAVMLKRECLDLVGFSEARLGSIAATSTAQGIQSSLTQSYSQTAPFVAQHEVVVDKLYQVMLEAAQTVESKNEMTTLSYLNDQGMTGYLRVNGNQLSLRDLHVLSVSRSQDSELMMKLQGLAQEMIQNGADIHTISELYSSNSIRQWQKATKILAEHQEQIRQEQMAQQQAEMQQQAQLAQAQMQNQQQIEAAKMQNENAQKALDRASKERVAIITSASFGNANEQDLNADSVPDVLELTKLNNQVSQANSQQNLAIQQLTVKREEIAAKTELGKQKLAVDRENFKNDIQVAKENAKGRNTKK